MRNLYEMQALNGFRPPVESPSAQLTARQREVLELLCEGLQNKQYRPAPEYRRRDRQDSRCQHSSRIECFEPAAGGGRCHEPRLDSAVRRRTTAENRCAAA